MRTPRGIESAIRENLGSNKRVGSVRSRGAIECSIAIPLRDTEASWRHDLVASVGVATADGVADVSVGPAAVDYTTPERTFDLRLPTGVLFEVWRMSALP